MSRQWTKPLEWSNEGAEPSTTLKETGFVGGYKPPAGVFNYAFNKNQTCIEELQGAIDDVDGDIATLGTSKQAKITGAATTITGSNLTADRALVSDSSGKVAVSAVTTTELGYLDGVTSNVQTQLNGKSASNHTHSVATTSANGYMSSTDKAKLNGIEAGANKTTVDSTLSSTSTNPVQNKVINTALAEKADTSHTHALATTSSSGFMSAGDKSELSNLSVKALTTDNIVESDTEIVIGTSVNSETAKTKIAQVDIMSGSKTDTNIEFINTTYGNANTTQDGLMSSEDKTKLDGIDDDITAAVNAVQIGGRNIVTGTADMLIGTGGRAKGHWQKSNTGTIENISITDAPIAGISKGIKLTTTTDGNVGNVGIKQDNVFLRNDTTYTMSFWVRGSTNGLKCRLQAYYATKDDSCISSDIDISTEWKHITFTTNKMPAQAKEYSACYIYLLASSIGSTIDICGVKFEQGSKATDWSPAPEDLATANHTHAAVTTSSNGFMSSTDKAKLDNVTGTIKLVEYENLFPTAETAQTDTPVIAGAGATILNDVRSRTYSAGVTVIDQGNVATGDYSLAEGTCTTAVGNYSHAEGYYTLASGESSHAEGFSTTASGKNSHAEGSETQALGKYSHAEGFKTIANDFQTVIGRCNTSSAGATGVSDTTGDIFIIGKGSSNDSRSNALRVTTAGKAYGNGAFGSSGADYAEMFEYADENENGEDRRGLFVTLDGEKVRIANAEDDYILGVVSAAPCIVGDVQSEEWKDRYLRDVFGEKITETVEVEETTDENGVTIPAHTETRYVINPEYDPEKKYTSRDNRKEWAAVGMIGKLIVVDDGTCQVNGYCKPDKDGKATAAETGYRVMSRIDKTHIRILFK